MPGASPCICPAVTPRDAANPGLRLAAPVENLGNDETFLAGHLSALWQAVFER